VTNVNNICANKPNQILEKVWRWNCFRRC